MPWTYRSKLQARFVTISHGMTQTTRHRPAQITLALCLAVLFLLTHPYTGIRHDAILYTAQALYNLHPVNFAGDLFFRFGSQDSWTIYGTLYSKLISTFGIRASNLACLFVAQVLWWSGAWRLIRKLLPPPWHWFSLFFVACMPADYGSSMIFSYDEIFLTARLPAEGLGLWAIALTLERRNAAAFALAAIATAIHPLIGAVSLAIVALHMTPRVKWLPIFLIALTAFAIIELPLFPSLHLQPFDPEWRGVAQYNQPILFPTLWTINAWSMACWAIALPAIMCSIERPENRRFWSNLTLVGVAGLAFSTVADAIGQDAIGIQLQTWRVLWLLTLMQWPAIALLIGRASRTRPMLIWLLGLCWLLLDVGGGIIALSIAVVLFVDAHRKTPSESAALRGAIPLLCRNLLICTTLVCVSLWLVWQAFYHHERVLYPIGSIQFNVGLLEALIHTRLAIVIAAMLIVLNLARDRITSCVLYVMLIALGAYGLVNSDQRSDIAKVLEARLDHANLAPFEDQVPAGGIVYWDGPPDELVYAWLLMKRSSYFSPLQAGGMIFHRETAFEAIRRFARIKRDDRAGRPPGKSDTADELALLSRQTSHTPLSSTALNYVCQDPVLDFVVSRSKYPDLSTHRAWSPGGQVEYWLYDCRLIRSLSKQTGTTGKSTRSFNAQG